MPNAQDIFLQKIHKKYGQSEGIVRRNTRTTNYEVANMLGISLMIV
jgi:hypothetical protein